MKILVLCYSVTGNNRLLGQELARRLDGDFEEIVAPVRLGMLGIILRMAFGFGAKPKELNLNPLDYDRVIVTAPVWDSHVAGPALDTLRRYGGRIGPYLFATFCGYRRAKQTETLNRDLADVLGHAPISVTELVVGDTMGGGQTSDHMKVAKTRLVAADLDRYQDQLNHIVETIGNNGDVAPMPPQDG